MKIYIIRHGQTDANRKNQLQGRRDIPLNQEGRAQAERIQTYFDGQGIRFDRVYSSPLGRAVETAKIAAGENATVQTDERLIEMDYGPYEGVDLKNPPEEIIEFFSDFTNNSAPDGMEQLASVTERAGRFLESIAGDGVENVLVSTHAILMKGLLEYLTPDSNGSYWSKYIGNCAVYRTEWDGGSFSVPVEVTDLAEKK